MMREVIERCRDNLNVVRVGEHHGFYKHADVEALLSSHSTLLEALEIIADGCAGVRAPHRFSIARDIARAAIAKATGADQ